MDIELREYGLTVGKLYEKLEALLKEVPELANMPVHIEDSQKEFIQFPLVATDANLLKYNEYILGLSIKV